MASDSAVTPFLTDLDGRVLAGILHNENRADVWFVPLQSDHERWARLAFEAWCQSDPVHYTLLDSWRGARKWMTVDECRAKDHVDAVEEQFREAERQYAMQRVSAQDELSIRIAEADAGLRRLLRSQDDALVSAVVSTLSSFGFEVQLMDETNAPKGAKLEDLRVTSPDEADWVALAEVRGYKGGAKTDDLIRIGAFSRRMLLDEGREPSASWYIVNQFINDPPDSRPTAFSARPSDLAAFAETGGAVFDSRDLFLLHRDVDDGKLSRPDARHLLHHCAGLFRFEPR